MRNYSKESEWDKEKYKRLTFKVDRKKWEALTAEAQQQIKDKIRQILDRLK